MFCCVVTITIRATYFTARLSSHQCLVSNVPPPHRRHLARSLPVPRGSMHTGGFLSRLALSGAEGANVTIPPETKRVRLQRHKKHQIHFTDPEEKLQINVDVQLYILFQETQSARRLLLFFVLIDKKLRQFLSAWTSKTSPRPNRREAGWFFFKWWLICCSSNSGNHPI